MGALCSASIRTPEELQAAVQGIREAVRAGPDTTAHAYYSRGFAAIDDPKLLPDLYAYLPDDDVSTLVAGPIARLDGATALPALLRILAATRKPSCLRATLWPSWAICLSVSLLSRLKRCSRF